MRAAQRVAFARVASTAMGRRSPWQWPPARQWRTAHKDPQRHCLALLGPMRTLALPPAHPAPPGTTARPHPRLGPHTLPFALRVGTRPLLTTPPRPAAALAPRSPAGVAPRVGWGMRAAPLAPLVITARGALRLLLLAPALACAPRRGLQATFTTLPWAWLGPFLFLRAMGQRAWQMGRAQTQCLTVLGALRGAAIKAEECGCQISGRGGTFGL